MKNILTFAYIIGVKTGRPKGSENKIKKELREILSGFVETKMKNISRLYDELPPREKAKFILDILPYSLPKLNAVDHEDKASLAEEKESLFFSQINEMIFESTKMMEERKKYGNMK